MGCFSAEGKKVKQQCIFPYERVKYGWMNSDLFIEFNRDVFHPYVMQNHDSSIPVISFVDGHSSHLSLDACLLCDKLDIILVQLYPNSTFLTQLADVSCFRSLKSIW